MGDFLADPHETNALEEMSDWKELTSHRTVGKGLAGGFLAGFEPGDDRPQSILHERKLFVSRSHRVAFALDLLEPGNHWLQPDVLTVALFVPHQVILS
jgi:hypothetical protein